MKILVFNCGSSSLKYRVIEMDGERELAGGEAQRIGPPTAKPSCIVRRMKGGTETLAVPMADHAGAFAEVMRLLEHEELMPDAVGHRVVHGGSRFTASVMATAAVVDELRGLNHLAPIHNPPAIALVDACLARYPALPQVLVFDTAFHSTMPAYASAYALPQDIVQRYGIRKYGFHGTSHQYVAEEAAKMLGMPMSALTAVSCHLGSGGASLCAIRNGESVDNTMGYSPLPGLVMSTRCGDIDPAVTLRLVTLLEGDGGAVEALLNRKSGVLGLSGFSADIRDIFPAGAGGEVDGRARHTADVYLWRLRKYLGSYLAVTGDARAIIFTDTIGETVPLVRWAVCAGLEPFGVRIDAAKNANASTLPADIAAADSAVRILVILTNEELAIARNTSRVLGRMRA
ncbi:acetate/propionate family kinase [bacterium]|nr:acetate/propionate family kinase [bacterium]